MKCSIRIGGLTSQIGDTGMAARKEWREFKLLAGRDERVPFALFEDGEEQPPCETALIRFQIFDPATKAIVMETDSEDEGATTVQIEEYEDGERTNAGAILIGASALPNVDALLSGELLVFADARWQSAGTGPIRVMATAPLPNLT